MRAIFMRDPQLGNIYLPRELTRQRFYPGGGVRSAITEIGIFVAKQCRPVCDEAGRLLYMRPLWWSFTHNERVDAGAQQQARQIFGGGGSPAAPSATVFPQVIAVANAALTKAKGDQSLGSTSAGVTTNEFIDAGLARAVAQALVGGDYTAPSSLGGTFSQVLKKTFTASAGATGKGAGVFDSTTVSGSILYVEDNFASDAVLVSGDTLTVTVTITN